MEDQTRHVQGAEYSVVSEMTGGLLLVQERCDGAAGNVILLRFVIPRRLWDAIPAQAARAVVTWVSRCEQWQYVTVDGTTRCSGWVACPQGATDSQLIAAIRRFEPGFDGPIRRGEEVDEYG